MESADSTEIERKYLVARLPRDSEQLTGTFIEQGYLAVCPDGAEVRLRRKGDRFFQTVKKGRGLVRAEAEIEISEAQFAALWPMTSGRRVSKQRYQLPMGGHVAELDVFCGTLEGLALVEVEFASIEDSRRFTPPDWFGADVTEDLRFKNQHLALHGMPADLREPNRGRR